MSEKNAKTAEKVDDIVAGKQTDRARKDHDERVKMIRERHEQEHERRLAELRAAEERGEKLLRTKEAEREKRAKEMKEKEFSRRHAVEDRRKQMELNENLKRQQILAKYDVAAASATAPTNNNNNNIVNSNSYNNSPTARSSFRQPRFGQFERNHPARSTYAFGSSTPRKLTYLERLDPSMKLYNTRLRSSDAGHHGNGLDDDSSVSMTASMCSQPRNVPGYGRRSFFGTNANPTALTMCTKRPAGFVYPSNRSNDVTSPSDISFASSCMTTSFALGDSSPSVTPIKNVRRQNYFSSTYSADCRNFVPSRAKAQTGTEKTIRSSKNVPERNDSSTPKPPPPRPPPPVRNKIAANSNVGQNKKSTVTTTKPTASISKEKTPPKNNSVVAPQNDDATKRFADDNVEVSMNSAMITANILNDNVLNSFQSNVVDAASIDNEKNTNEISTGEPIDEFGLNNETSSNSTLMAVNGTDDDETKGIPTSNSSNLLSSSTYGGELLSSVPTPTGKNLGKSLTMEEAKAALAERRRLAREQLEREKELEKQREEQKRLEEEELLRNEEEQFRLQEEEERRFLEETRKAEELRLQIAIEEERRRREEEERAAEDEKQRAIENEIKVREMNERLEKEREEKLRKEEEERLERKKKLDAIMQRTRQSATDNGNNSSSSGDEATTIKSSVETSSMTKSSSASVMKKFTDDVGRSVGSILNRVRSTTKADKTLITKTDNVDATNGGSISTSTMNVSPNFDHHSSSTGEENYFNSTPIHSLPVAPPNVDIISSNRNSNGCTTTNGDVVNNHNIYNNDDDNHLLVDLNNISFDINANNLGVDDVRNNGVVVDGVQRELITENLTSARIETVNFNDTTLTNGSATTKASSGEKVGLNYNDILNENVGNNDDDLMRNQNLFNF